MYEDKEVTASLEVVVVESLHSLTPLLPSNLVLLAPGATYQLATNRNNGKATYRSAVLPNSDMISHKQETVWRSRPVFKRLWASIFPVLLWFKVFKKKRPATVPYFFLQCCGAEIIYFRL